LQWRASPAFGGVNLLATLIEFDPRMFGLSRVRSRIKSFAAF
jgi:hypothetical protein